MRERNIFLFACALRTFPSIPAEITDKHLYLYAAQENVTIEFISLDKLTFKYLSK